MMKPTAPMMGGANRPRWSDRFDGGGEFGLAGLFMSGMVIAPVVATLARALPLIMPMRCAGDHGNLGGPASRATRGRARSLMKSLNPLASGKPEARTENIGGGHADAHAEEPLAAPEHVLDDAIP